MENTETMVWLDFSFDHGYITLEQKQNLLGKTEEIGRLLNYMTENAEKFTWKGNQQYK